MNTNESETTMTERRRYYALTDDDVETLIRAAETWARTLQMNDRPAEAELRAVSNLTPLDEDDAVTEDMVERAAEAIFLHGYLRWNDWATEARARVSLEATKAGRIRGWKEACEDARAALRAALETTEEA